MNINTQDINHVEKSLAKPGKQQQTQALEVYLQRVTKEKGKITSPTT